MHASHDHELILYYYGETRDGEAVRRRLAASPSLRAHYDELCRVLAAIETQPVPELPEDYGSHVWHRLAPRLLEQPRQRGLFSWLVEFFPTPRQMAWAGGVAVLVVLAFLVGRGSSRVVSPELPVVAAERPGERMFLVTVGRHLERSEMLLVELANAENPGNLGPELLRADALLGANRLYRQAARKSGAEGVADLLEELERLLLELTHRPEEFSQEELASLRQQIDGGGMLFRMRIVSARMERGHSRGLRHDSQRLDLPTHHLSAVHFGEV